MTAFPQNANVYFDLGVFACEAEDYHQAKTYLNQAILLNPDAAHFHHWLGKVYFRTGRFYQAVEQFQKTLSVEALEDEQTSVAEIRFEDEMRPRQAPAIDVTR